MSDWTPVGSHPPIYHIDPVMVAAHYCARLDYDLAIKEGRPADYDVLLSKRLKRIKEQAAAPPYRKPKKRRGGDAALGVVVAVVGLVALFAILSG